MAPCYDALRRTLVASLLALIASAAPAAAQFMYLDADGDGVPTLAHVVTPGGPVVFDVWLATDHDADGTLKTCAQDGATPLNIRGYYFVLKVRNGELAVSSVTNQISSFTRTWADSHTSTQILLWRSGETPLPPGTYRLATVTAQIPGHPVDLHRCRFRRRPRLDHPLRVGVRRPGSGRDALPGR